MPNNENQNMLTIPADNKTVQAVVNQIKSDMRGRGKYATYATEFGVTRDNVKDHALALARLVTPETAQKKDGARTRFGNAVQAAGNGLRSVLDKAEPKDTDWIRLVRQAAENAHAKGEFPVDVIVKNVIEALNDEITSDTAAA